MICGSYSIKYVMAINIHTMFVCFFVFKSVLWLVFLQSILATSTMVSSDTFVTSSGRGSVFIR